MGTFFVFPRLDDSLIAAPPRAKWRPKMGTFLVNGNINGDIPRFFLPKRGMSPFRIANVPVGF